MGEVEGRLNYKSAIKTGLSFLLLFAISFFFYRKFQTNWEHIQSSDLKINIWYVFLAFTAIVITYLLTTYAWFLAVNTLSLSKITFTKSIAVVNSANLTKYIPGKVWSYALQLIWLEGSGFSKSLILYVNFLNLGISLLTAMMLGLSYLLLFPAVFPFTVTIPLLIGLIVLDAIFILYSSAIIRAFLSVINTVFKRDIRYFNTSIKLLLSLHVICFIADLSFGLGAYLLCFGIGFEVEVVKMFAVMSSILLSEVAGVVTFIAPGGLGVREGAMYLLLKDISSGALSILLPVATRLVSMLVDVFLGTMGFLLLKRFKAFGK